MMEQRRKTISTSCNAIAGTTYNYIEEYADTLQTKAKEQ